MIWKVPNCAIFKEGLNGVLVFAVKLVKFLMFAVSEESTVKCLEGSSDIFGNGRTSSLVFENVRQSSEIWNKLS